MVLSDGVIVNAEAYDILTALRLECHSQGVMILSRIRKTSKNVMICCPFHSDGMERNPSMGVADYDGTCHCFTCGWVGSIELMISLIFGHYDEGAFGRRWILKSFSSVSVSERPKMVLPWHEESRDREPGFDEKELDSYRYIHPYMYERGLTDEIIEEFDIGYDSDSPGYITFPVYDEKGFPAFIARRAVVGKFFNYPEQVRKPVYLLHYVHQMDPIPTEVYVTESMLDALNLWKLGMPSVSLLGLGADHQYEWLLRSPIRSYVLAFDGDNAGDNADARFRDKVGTTKLIQSILMPDGKDVSDMQEQVLKLEKVL